MIDAMDKLKKYLPVFLTMLVPASGYLLLGRYYRGFIMLLWMLVMSFITYQLTDESISFIGRYSGGFAILALSVLEVHTISSKREHPIAHD